MPGLSLHHCVIHVSNWERSNAFYHDVLGAEIVPMGNGWAYRFGTIQLNVHGPGFDPEPVARIPVPPGGSDLCFVWPGTIGEARAHLGQHAVPIELGPVSRTGAHATGVSLYFRDPDGSLLEFISYENDEVPGS